MQRVGRLWIVLGVVWIVFIGFMLISWHSSGTAPSPLQWVVPGCGLAAAVCGLLDARARARAAQRPDEATRQHRG